MSIYEKFRLTEVFWRVGGRAGEVLFVADALMYVT